MVYIVALHLEPHIVQNDEIFEWKMKFDTEMSWICVGVCPDDSLKVNETDITYGYNYNQGCFLVNSNGFIHAGDADKYCPYDKLHKKKYRLAVIQHNKCN